MSKKSNDIVKFISTIVLISFISTNACADIYGKLEFKDGEHKLVKVSNYSDPSMIDLNNPSLTVPYNTNRVSCMGRWYNKDSRCIEKDEATFRDTSYNVRPYMLPVVHAITGGLMFMFGVISAKTCYFDYDAYYKAVQKVREDDIVKDVEKANDEFSKYASAKSREFSDYAKQATDSLFNDYSKKYNSAVDNLRIKYKFIDKSGFFNTNEMINLVQKEKNRISIKLVEPSNYYIAYDAEPNTAIAVIKSKIPVIDSTYASDMNALTTSLQNYKSELEEETSTVKLAFNNDVDFGYYHLNLQGPRVLSLNNDTNSVDVTCTISSKDFYGIYPTYHSSDNNIDVNFDGTYITLKNKTKIYQQVKSITIYYNDYIVNTEVDIELPPNSIKRDLPISSYINDSIKSQSNYPRINRTIAQKTNILFGLAVKYRIVEQNVDKTLFNTSNNSLLTTLKNLGKI